MFANNLKAQLASLYCRLLSFSLSLDKDYILDFLELDQTKYLRDLSNITLADF